MSTTTDVCRGWLDAHGVRVPCERDAEVRRLRVVIAGAAADVVGLCGECQGRSEAAEFERRRERFLDELIRRSDAGDRLRAFDLSTYPTGLHSRAAMVVALEWLARYQEGERKNLYLWGNAGRGKSGLAWALARRIAEDAIAADPDLDRLPAVFVNFRLLMARIKEGWDSGERTGRVSQYFGVRVLVVDDVGSERPTAFNRDELLNLIDARYERRLPTIFTSNMRPGDLGERLSGASDETDGLRIVSRITEDIVVHEIGGRDLRRRAA